jgi:hypothetical protein
MICNPTTPPAILSLHPDLHHDNRRSSRLFDPDCQRSGADPPVDRRLQAWNMSRTGGDPNVSVRTRDHDKSSNGCNQLHSTFPRGPVLGNVLAGVQRTPGTGRARPQVKASREAMWEDTRRFRLWVFDSQVSNLFLLRICVKASISRYICENKVHLVLSRQA